MSKIIYTEDRIQWIKENAELGIFKTQKHFTDVFNAVHGTNVTYGSMNRKLYDLKISVKTPNNTDHYTEKENQWIKDNYSVYDNDWVSFARDFNAKFNRTDMTNCRLAKHCERRLNIHIPKEKKGRVNRGTFVKGNISSATEHQLPIGTVRTYTSKTSKILYVKVRLADGDSGLLRDAGHNYKRPWWIPLKEKVWIDNYGEIPEGYSVVQLDRDYKNCDITNLAILNKRGSAIMMSKKWWTENAKLTGTAVQWCNLYIIAKDNNII